VKSTTLRNFLAGKMQALLAIVLLWRLPSSPKI